jgi:DNA-binding MarR family transcriptional regulator
MERLLGYELKRAQQASRSAADVLLAPLGLTSPQYLALALLEETPGLSSAELARRCFVTPQTMNAMVLSLEERGLVARVAHPVHGRILETSITPKGRALLARGRDVMVSVNDRMTADLTDREHATLLSLLRRCIDALEPAEEDEWPSRSKPARALRR